MPYLRLSQSSYHSDPYPKLEFNVSSTNANGVPINIAPIHHKIYADKANQVFLTPELIAEFHHLVDIERAATLKRQQFVTNYINSIHIDLQTFIENFPELYPEELI